MPRLKAQDELEAQIRRKWDATPEAERSVTKLAQEFNVSRNFLSAVVNRPAPPVADIPPVNPNVAAGKTGDEVEAEVRGEMLGDTVELDEPAKPPRPADDEKPAPGGAKKALPWRRRGRHSWRV